MKLKKILISVITLILCLSICTGCSSISSIGAEDGSVQKEMSKNQELNDEINDIFEDTGLTGECSVKDNTIIFKIDMSNFTGKEDKDITDKDEQRILKLVEKSFSNDDEFDTILKELKQYYDLEDVTLRIELEHNNKVIWSKEYKEK